MPNINADKMLREFLKTRRCSQDRCRVASNHCGLCYAQDFADFMVVNGGKYESSVDAVAKVKRPGKAKVKR